MLNTASSDPILNPGFMVLTSPDWIFLCCEAACWQQDFISSRGVALGLGAGLI